jgi:hypothetical protein
MVVVNNNSTTESPLYFGEGIDINDAFSNSDGDFTSLVSRNREQGAGSSE